MKPTSSQTINTWSARMVESILQRYMPKDFSWNYDHGLQVLAIQKAGEATGEEHYLKFVADWIDYFVQPDGTIRTYNMENIGQISNMPLHTVVETNAYFSRDSITPLTAGALPAGIAPLINQHNANQELIIEAALTDDTALAFQAFFNDPSNHLPLDASWELFNKMLQLNQEHLPAMAA